MNTNYSNLLENKKAIIFDLDGTILNSEPLHAKAITRVLETFKNSNLLPANFEVPNSEYLISHFHGYSDDLVLSKIFPEDQKTLNLEVFIKKKSEAFEQVLLETSVADLKKELLPGIENFLEKKSKEDILLGLVTASSERIGRLILDKFNFTRFFDLLLFREDTYFTKPSPSPYFRALRKLNLFASEVLIFEDSSVGLEAALATGAEVIQVTKFVKAKRNFNLLKINSI